MPGFGPLSTFRKSGGRDSSGLTSNGARSDEEVFLIQQLPGYAAYRDKTRYRLIPFVW